MRSKQRAFLCFKSVFITRPGLQQWSKYSLVIDSNDYWSLIQNFTGEWRKFKEENRTRYQEMVTPWGTSETEHGLDSGPLTLTVKYSVPCLFHKEKKKKKIKLCTSWVAHLAGMQTEDAYCKEDTYCKDWWRPDQTSLHQDGPQCWTFTDFFPHNNTKNPTHGGDSTLFRHVIYEEAWILNA